MKRYAVTETRHVTEEWLYFVDAENEDEAIERVQEGAMPHEDAPRARYATSGAAPREYVAEVAEP